MNEKNYYEKTKVMRILLSAFVLVVVLMMPALRTRAAIATSGVIEDGTNRTEWEYDKGTKTLIIQGKGEMLTNGNDDWGQLSGVQKVIIKEGITSVANSAFAQMYDITSVELPNGITAINDRAFLECTALTSVSMPDTVISIGESVFLGCHVLKSFNMPDTVVSIGDSAFYCCYNLKNIAIPNKLESIGKDAFVSCGAFDKIEIPQSVKNIGAGAFRGDKPRCVTISEGLSKIEAGVFADCYDLIRVFLPKTVEYIAPTVFNNDDDVVIYCNNDYQIEYCKQYNIEYIDARNIYELNDNNVKFYKNSANVEFEGTKTKIVLLYNGIRLVEDEDYIAQYENADTVGRATVTITGIGAYSGTVVKNYTITQADIWNITKEEYQYLRKGDYDIYVDGELWNGKDTIPFTGKKHSIKISNMWYGSKENILKEGVDYKITEESGNGYNFWFCRVTGIGKYTGSFAVQLDMEHVDINSCDVEMVSDDKATFNNQNQIPEFIVSYKGYVFPKGAYSVEWKEADDNHLATDFRTVNVGKVTLKTSPFNNYSIYEYAILDGDYYKEFDYEIQTLDISDAEVIYNKESFVIGADNNEIRPEYGDIGIKLGDYTCWYSTESDFNVEYTNNSEPGTATAIIKGKDNCIGEVHSEFKIVKNIASCQISTSDKQLFTGKDIRPEVIIKDNDIILQEDKDYTLTYSNNIDEGVADIIITGKYNYVGSKTLHFNIDKLDISAGKISLDQTSFTYDGTDKKPGAKIEYDGKILVENTDYNISYIAFDSVGQASVVANGKGVYKGTLKAEYTINSISIDDASVSLKDTIFTYDGSAKKPSAEVKLNDTLLTEGKDYTLSYRDNINEGTAYAVVEGIGIYSGTIEVSFKILAYNSGMDAVYKEEDTLLDDNYIYHIIDVDDKEVEFSAPANKNETNVVIPSTITTDNGDVFTVTSIGEKAFYKNTKIKKLTITNTVTSIENYAFYGCKNLTSVKIGNGIEIIGDSAFRKCTKLTSITLPKSIDKLGKNCFYGCKKLKTITIKSNQVVDVQSNAIKGVSKKCVIKVPKKLVKKYKKEFKKNTGFTKTMKIKKQ